MAAAKMLFSFLLNARATAAAAPRLHAVFGNEACDADSIVSAITYAWYLRCRGSGETSAAILPIVTCSADDLPLRREACFLLQRTADAAHGTLGPLSEEPRTSLQWVADHLVHMDRITVDAIAARLPRSGESNATAPAAPVAAAAVSSDGSSTSSSSSSASGASPGSISMTLMDHNALSRPLSYLPGASAAVVEIVDHHADSGQHTHVTGGDRRISFDAAAGRGVGSTCTLVSQSMLSLPASCVDAALAELLLGVILLDTAGLSAAAGKTTPEDEAAVAALQAVIAGERGAPVDVRAFADRLLALREDASFWRSLSASQALRYDYKGFDAQFKGANVRVGSSSFMAPLTSILAGWREDSSSSDSDSSDSGAVSVTVAPEVGEQLQSYAAQQGAAILLLMSVTTKPAMSRQLAMVHVPGPHAGIPSEQSQAAYETLLAALTADAAGLKLQALPVAAAGAAAEVKLFQQGNVKASRKQVMPLVLAALQQ